MLTLGQIIKKKVLSNKLKTWNAFAKYVGRERRHWRKKGSRHWKRYHCWSGSRIGSRNGSPSGSRKGSRRGSRKKSRRESRRRSKKVPLEVSNRPMDFWNEKCLTKKMTLKIKSFSYVFAFSKNWLGQVFSQHFMMKLWWRPTNLFLVASPYEICCYFLSIRNCLRLKCGEM